LVDFADGSQMYKGKSVPLDKTKSMNLNKLVAISFALLFVSCSSPDASEQSSIGFDYFGDTVDVSSALEINQIINKMKTGEDSVYSTFSAPINSICQKKGCWMELDLGNGENALVRFKDYGFFVPMDATGEIAIVEGAMTIDTLDVDWLRHQASDAGKSDSVIASINAFEISYSILATGVALERKKMNEESLQLED
tara:strand:- start:1744 stop:2331 length:588 start_codon:yes stop_codon:yes gene_type:complete